MSDNAESIAADGPRVERVLSLIGDPAGLRILDLACRTGWFATALAERGATVLGIEGRAVNADLIRPHPNLTVEIGDVRGLSRDRHGMFDVSLCLGILYHLEAEAVLGLLCSLAQVTSGYTIIDTNTCTWGPGPAAAGPRTAITLDGATWEGCYFSEGGCSHPWTAIGNPSSFWFDPGDLQRLILRAGFSSVERIPGKGHPLEPDERMWFRAVP